ncbi:MAG: hypothetical protein K940chlam9_01740 [Chlamydiae bacterium]|nr:hypothetical protein [Chlamydiota bacterium]
MSSVSILYPLGQGECDTELIETCAERVKNHLKTATPSSTVNILPCDKNESTFSIEQLEEIEYVYATHVYCGAYEGRAFIACSSIDGVYSDDIITSAKNSNKFSRICVTLINVPPDLIKKYANNQVIAIKGIDNENTPHVIGINVKNVNHEKYAQILREKYFVLRKNKEAMWKTVLRIVSFVTIIIPLIAGCCLLYFTYSSRDVELVYNLNNSWTHWPEKEKKSGCCCPKSEKTFLSRPRSSPSVSYVSEQAFLPQAHDEEDSSPPSL